MPVSKEEDARFEVASHYLADAIMHVRAARICSKDDAFWTTKGGKGKLASFLVVACECLLKGAAARFDRSGGNVADIVWSLIEQRHDLTKLLAIVQQTEIHESAKDAFRDLVGLVPDRVRVDLRYTVEAWGFEDDDENSYYRTVGCETWHDEIENRIFALLDHPDLQWEGETVDGADVDLEILNTPWVKWEDQLEAAKLRARAKRKKDKSF